MMPLATLGRWPLPPGFMATTSTSGADIELLHPGVGTGRSRFENASASLEVPEREIVRHAWQAWRESIQGTLRGVQTLDGGRR